MKTRVQKWGNSLAVRIPKTLARETRLEQDTEVDLLLVDGNLIVSPAAKAPETLDQLLAAVTEANLHGEWATGTSVGGEIW